VIDKGKKVLFAFIYFLKTDFFFFNIALYYKKTLKHVLYKITYKYTYKIQFKKYINGA
jgi:hypothetical protein